MNEVIKNINDWEVLTPSGWSDFSDIKKIQKSSYYHITFSDGNELKCSDTHKIKLYNNEWVYAKDLLIGDVTIDNQSVTLISEIHDDIELYDLLNVELGNEYYTNNILSHNCAFIDYIDEIWASAQQTLATGGKCIALSTPNGMGNWFHKAWVGAKDGTNKFNPINLHWSLHPDRDQSWRDEQDEILGPKLAAQECDCSFLSSGNTVIPGEVLQWYKDTHVKEPIEKRGLGQEYWLWDYPNYSKNYIVTADVARGDGADYSTFNILEVETMEQVASYKGKVDTKEFGRFLSQVGHEWNEALVVVENANIGWAVLQEMIDIGYPNIFYSSRDMQVVDVHYSYVDKKRNPDNPITPGFTTSSKTRPMLISKLDEYVRKKETIIKDSRLIDELFTFIWQGQRAEAMRGYNDDLVMSYAIALWIRDTALRLRMEGMELTKQAINSIKRTTVGGIISSNTMDVNPYVQEINGEKIDLTWLFDKH